ncbi:protein arginine kinase [Paenibacillus ginsengarvi]|uniref:Protein-arginine kinase n=1 Tax=Paenibacillus ginsengarvi TaxID=400777 RepID=A0A3B0AXM4_9BACL|nr:protein arginine kinase [Paenibacillus ginsengarvi]
MKGNSPESDVVISTRIRLARNLRSHPFPMLSTNTQSKEVMDRIVKVMQSDELLQISGFDLFALDQLDELQKRVLVEKHLISPNLANESRNGAVLISQNEAVSIMVNEEDHLRIQCLSPGFQIRESWELADRIDDVFESQLDFAFDERRGFLTSCPTNVGTGIRASVMMHLPALVLTQQMNRILQAINQVGLAVRGIYGEGSEALGNIFQVSNQITLGQSEEEIIDNLHSVAKQIIEHERAARHKLLEESKMRVADRVQRSYGILSNAVIMDSKEAAQRLSDVRLGVDLGLLDVVSPHVLNELNVMTQPGFLQQYAGNKLSADDRDVRRAELIRHKMASKS